MAIEDLAISVIDNYYEEGFIELIEQHLNYFRQSGNYDTIIILDQEGYKYEGDFYGLLNSKDISPNLHYAAVRLNNMRASSDYTGAPGTFLIPNSSVLNTLVKIYNQTQTSR